MGGEPREYSDGLQNIEYGALRNQEIRILIKVHNLLTIVAVFQFGGFVGLIMTVYMLVSGAI